MTSTGGRTWSLCKKEYFYSQSLQLKVASYQPLYIYLLYFNTILFLLGAGLQTIPWLTTNRRGERGGKGGQLREGLGRKGAPVRIASEASYRGEGYDT